MPRWTVIIFIIFIGIASAWFGNISSGGLIEEGTMDSLEALMTFRVFDLGGTLGFLNADWVDAWDITLSYPMFEGDYAQYVKIGLYIAIAGFFVLIGTWVAQLIRG